MKAIVGKVGLVPARLHQPTQGSFQGYLAGEFGEV